MTTRAVSLLLQNFPSLPEMVKESIDGTEPYYAYGLLAAELTKRQNDGLFLLEVCRFASEIAKTHDAGIKDVLIVGFLEAAADDPELASKMKEHLGPEARELLKTIEIEMFGRSG